MPEANLLEVKKIVDITDEIKRRKLQLQLITRVRESISQFNDAYRPRRERMLEINAIYRNKSYLDKNRAIWQTSTFQPFSYGAVETKTSILHEALWGNRLAAPFTVIGRTAEDHEYAFSAETHLNNTMDRIGFYEVSEEGLRSTVKYGLGVYHYGWMVRKESVLWREAVRNAKGEVERDKDERPILKYVKRDYKTSQPFVNSIDVVDGFFYDPTCKRLDKWECDYAGFKVDETPESIWENEQRNVYDKGSFDKVAEKDPHGFDELMGDAKVPQIRRDEDVEDPTFAPKTKYKIAHWWGWFDVQGNGKREFIRCSIVDERVILRAETVLLPNYPFVDVQYSRSLHGLTPWGVLDPVIDIQYEINELHNQRGDAIKLKINPQFLVNIDKIIEDHAYVSEPGALHPFHAEDGDVREQMRVLEFQNMEFLSTNEEDRLVSVFSQGTGVADLNKVLTSANKNTPASTVISIFNQQQSGNSMIVNGVLNRHGTLGGRILYLLQVYGDEEFTLRSAGRRGLEFRKESLLNILGEFDTKVTTSTFFGNRQIELQHLIQLKPLWQNAPHIDQVELDKAILENILPKRVEKIIKIPDDPMAPIDELALFMAGQGESVEIVEAESVIDLRSKLRFHESTTRRTLKSIVEKDKSTAPVLDEFEEYLTKVQERITQLEQIEQLQAQQLARQGGEAGGPGTPAINGNLQNTGIPEVRAQGNANRPRTNNF